MWRRIFDYVRSDLRAMLGSNPAAILAGVGIIIVALIVIVAVTLVADNAEESRQDRLSDEIDPFAIRLEQLQNNLLALSSDTQGFVLTADPMFRDRYEAERDMLAETLPQTVTAGRRAGFEREMLAIVAATRPFIASSDAVVRAVEAGQRAEAERLVRDEGAPRLADASLSIDQLQQGVRAEVDRLRGRIDEIDRVERYVLLLAGPLGIIAASVLIWLALTNQRLLGSAHADRARFLSMMTSLSRHGICQIDANGRIEYCNPAADDMLGYGADELAGLSLHDAAHYKRLDGSACVREQCSFAKGLFSGSRYKAEDLFVRKDGKFVPVDVTAEPIVVLGRPAGAVIVLEDITQRQRQEQFRQQFLSFASHELRTPLMIIGGFAQILQKRARSTPERFDEATREAISEIVQGAVRMRRITEIVLDLTQVQSGSGLALEPRTVDMRELLEKELVALKSTYPEVRVSTAYPPVPLLLESDEARVRQVVLNLLDNAVKHGGQPPEVVLSVATDDSRLTVSVKDNGPGIAPEDRALVFEQFYRGVKAADKGGLGVGLFITKRIVDRLGGTLSFESAEDKGTEFLLTLPVILPGADGGR